ncbi:hypothetical protein GQ55_7G224000 [Panicum hallii var. hallii]|uniref:UDP-glycosyltransferases domain-containing protein n=1 Tax=Panicum hallii var. hallii TaxID=1504633 RepID=A0A2T7CXU9_9POAL|nr:hypothetical protein GQ55_7G224000 [Panicum hallii var. hallii]
MAPRRPSCIVAGVCNKWAHGVARDLSVPCFVFHGFSAFALLCCEYLHTYRPHESAAASMDDRIHIPVLPPYECKLAMRQLPVQFLPSCTIPDGRRRETREFEMATDGIVVNSFEELDHGSAARLAAATGKTVLAVGPVSLLGAPSLLDLQADSVESRRCMAWLDAKKAKSVLYVNFGSAGRLPPAQLMQLARTLVSCPWPVLWVIKGVDSLPGGVKERLQRNTDADGVADSQCLAVRGWAPQVAILEAGAPRSRRLRDALRLGLDAGEHRRGRAHGYLAALRGAVPEREARRRHAWCRRVRRRDEAHGGSADQRQRLRRRGEG